MFGYGAIERPPAIEGIKIIDELLTDEQKALLTLKMGQREITPLKQLKALYEGLYCLYPSLDEFEAAAASIINKQLLEFKKLAVREQTLNDQANIESYYQVSEKLENGSKGTGIKGSAAGGTNNVTMNVLKNREGQAAYAKEFNIEQVWDQQNFEQLEFAAGLQSKHQLAKDWKFQEIQAQNEEDVTKYIAEQEEAAAKPETAPKPPELTQPPTSEDNEDEDMSVQLNTINLTSQSNLNFTKNNSYTESGKRVESSKTNKTKTKQYTKGRAIRAFQEAQEAAIRERIFARFEVLFTNRRCQ